VAIRAVTSGTPSYRTDSPYGQQHEHVRTRLLLAQITEQDARSRLARRCIIRYLKDQGNVPKMHQCEHRWELWTVNPAPTRPSHRCNGLEPVDITARPRWTVYPVSPTGPPPSALGDAEVDDGTEHKHNKASNHLRRKAFVVSLAGFEPVNRTRGSWVSLRCPAVLIRQRIQRFVCLACRSQNTHSIPSW